MNAKKFIIACIAVIVFIMAFDYVFHGMYMTSTYKSTASLWRPEADMKTHVFWIIIGQIIISIGFVALFTKAFKRGGIIEGAVFGLLLAIIFAGHNLIGYAVSPYPANLVISWVVAIIIELVIAGIIVALIYQNKSA
jgi:hypothetical protein